MNIPKEMMGINQKIILENEKFLSRSQAVPANHRLKLSDEEWKILLKHEPHMAKGKPYMGIIILE